jgi:hypothetical protein
VFQNKKNQENSCHQNYLLSFDQLKNSNTIALGVLHKFSILHQLWLDRLEKKF